MQQLDAVLVKTSLVDYPERVAAACFLRGCNLCCPYCYNTELVAPNISQAQDSGNKKIVGSSPTMTNAASHVIDSPRERTGESLPLQNDAKRRIAARDAAIFISIDQVIAHLKKRANVLSGFVISGGEPLCHPDVVRDLIIEARSLGYKIKLDTNGMFPDRLQKLLDDPAARPDYIALDVKTSPARYNELQASAKASQAQNSAEDSKAVQDQNAAAQKIIDSIKIVSGLPADAREFRTVLYPPLVGEKEIKEIASVLPKDARWYFAHFLNGRCLNPDAEKIVPYDEKTEADLVELAQAKIPGAIIR